MSTPGLTRALRPCGSGLLFVGKTSARFTAHDHQLDSSRQTRFKADQNLLNEYYRERFHPNPSALVGRHPNLSYIIQIGELV